MADISKELCLRLAQARRQQGMTQSALAQAVGCKQPAISMLEAGQPSKVAQETVEKIAAVLGVDLEPLASSETAGETESAATGAPVGIGYCPNALCYSNIPLVVGETLLFWPRMSVAARQARCLVCGECLERSCPHCGKAVLEQAACCGSCGGALITNILPLEVEPSLWVARQRRDIKEWLEMI